jgi:hypothetical protein
MGEISKEEKVGYWHAERCGRRKKSVSKRGLTASIS